jgi:hypothetical protein
MSEERTLRLTYNQLADALWAMKMGMSVTALESEPRKSMGLDRQSEAYARMYVAQVARGIDFFGGRSIEEVDHEERSELRKRFGLG